MKRSQQTAAAQPSRDDAIVRCGWHTSALTVTSFAGVVAMLGTPVTAKINPRRALGGLPQEGNP